jgi:hypothetical protein
VTDVAAVPSDYYGRSQPRAQPAWHGTWTRADALPELVELTLEHSEGSLSLTIELQLRTLSAG